MRLCAKRTCVELIGKSDTIYIDIGFYSVRGSAMICAREIGQTLRNSEIIAAKDKKIFADVLATGKIPRTNMM